MCGMEFVSQGLDWSQICINDADVAAAVFTMFVSLKFDASLSRYYLHT